MHISISFNAFFFKFASISCALKVSLSQRGKTSQPVASWFLLALFACHGMMFEYRRVLHGQVNLARVKKQRQRIRKVGST